MTVARRRTAAARAAAVLGVLGSVLVPLLVAAVVAAPAAEAASYRYWTYWWGQPDATSWTFAQLGPASDRPKDASVIGWRFAVTTETGGKKSPRASLPFGSLCPTLAGSPAPTGEKRVGVVIDYGSTADAPPGESPPGGGTARVECVTVAANATGVAVLNAAGVSLRFGDNGLVCGIDRYPRTECAAIVADPTPTPKPTPTSATPTPKPTTARPTASAVDGSSATAPAQTRAAGTTAAASSTAPSETAAIPDRSSSAPATSDETTEAPLPVSSGAPVASGTEGGGSSSPLAPVAGVALVAAVGAGAWWTARGRRA